MQIKMKTVTVARFIFILSSVFFFGCNKYSKQEKKDYAWSAAMSRPTYYVGEGFHVFYLRNGEIIGSTATLTHIPGNWSRWQSGRSSNYSGLLPDSVVVDYGGLNDKLEMCTYRGGMSLPVKEIEDLFRNGYTEKGEKKQFRHIITGMAPGGRICVWVDHIEVKRGVVQQKDIYYPYPVIISSKDSRKQDSIEINNFLKYHPVDYSVWEKPDPRYELDFGFCSENRDYEVVFMYMTSREGINNRIGYQSFEETNWMTHYGQPSNTKSGTYYITKDEVNDNKFKLQLPVHLKLSWQNKDETRLWCTDIVLPKNFKERFTKPYINPDTGRESNYNRLVFGVEKDGEHCIIWLDGPGKQEKLIRFKGHIAKRNESNGIKSGGYATEITYFE